MNPVSSATSHRALLPALSPASVPSSWTHLRTFTPLLNFGVQNAHSTQNEVAAVLNRVRWSPLLTSWLCCIWRLATADFEPAVSQYPQTHFCGAALQPCLSEFVLVEGSAVSLVQSPAFVLVQFHTTDDCSTLQSIHIPLQGLLSLRNVNSTSHFSIVSKFANSALDSCLQIIDKNFEQNWPWDWALRNTTGDWSPASLSILYNTLSPALQPVLSAHHLPAHFTVRLVQKDAGRDNIKSLIKIQKTHIHHLPFIY